jgi:actin-like protein 6A
MSDEEIEQIPGLLFREIPEIGFYGLPRMVRDSLNKLDTELRRDVISNLIVTGGCSIMPNFVIRLQKDIMAYAPEDVTFTKLKIFGSSNKMELHMSSWLGGSILGSLSTFDQFVMNQSEFKEHGAVLIERKCNN